MKFVPYNIGTFLVKSRSRFKIIHHIDLIECNCSCEAWAIAGSCEHLREAYRRRIRGELPIIVAMRGRDDCSRTETMAKGRTTLGKH